MLREKRWVVGGELEISSSSPRPSAATRQPLGILFSGLLAFPDQGPVLKSPQTRIMGPNPRVAVPEDGFPANMRILHAYNRLSLAGRFTLTSLLVFVLMALGLGWWVGREIESGVIDRSAATTALYVENFLEPQLQELGDQPFLSPSSTTSLNELLDATPLGKQVVRFKVWGRQGLVLYSTNAAQMGQRFPVEEGLALAWQKGQVSADMTRLDKVENQEESHPRPQLLETYVPIRARGSDRVIAVAEFYSLMDDLEREIASARWRSWLAVAAMTFLAYLALVGLVRRGSDTIARQQSELAVRVGELNASLLENQRLGDRVRRAATRTTALNERFLRRVSAELHDGPAQDLSYALLRLDGVMNRALKPNLNDTGRAQLEHDLNSMETSLKNAVGEIRAIASDLRLPELEHLTLPDTIQRAVRDHMRRTETTVSTTLEDLPEQVPLSVKITVFRLVQEALNNAFRHGGGIGQQVRLAGACPYTFTLEVKDDGPGFTWNEHAPTNGHLGLIGMRERVESIGGTFNVEAMPGTGTRISARVPYRPIQGDPA